MNLKEYLWFWKTSYSYMGGFTKDFIFGILPATYRYRKLTVEDKQKGLV